MSTLSKCFYEVSAGKTCRDLWHPEFTHCRSYIFDLWKRIIPGSFKLYLPLLILPPLVKLDGWSKSYLINNFIDYVKLSLATYVQAALSLTFQCTC
ncbi:AAEL010604-PA [Aedes aegypti]|uniref:AAEL010604-PA n=1 Tax=Aedes aegypti TaxID=7159 RepID=Q16SF3_AEDAE|nr:AAEL010604-PA [Aedes aegypti]